MPGIGDPVQTPSYCANCGSEVRSGVDFCVSCGARLEDGDDRSQRLGAETVAGPASTGNDLLSKREIALALYVSGALVFLVLAFLLFSNSFLLGIAFVALSAFAVLVVRKVRGNQTGFERRIFSESERVRRSAEKAYEEGKHKEIARGVYQSSRQAYEGASSEYRRWNDARLARAERDRLRAEFGRCDNFFRSTQRGADYFREWWEQYPEDHTPYEGPSVSDLLDDASTRAYVGLRMTEQQTGTFDELLSLSRFQEARDLLTTLRGSQERIVAGEGDEDGPLGPLQPVLEPLNLTVVKLREAKGWTRYKQEFNTFVLNSIGVLDSPVINAEIEAEKERIRRFPNPHHVNNAAEPKPKSGGGMTKEDWVLLGVSFLVFNQVFSNSNQQNRGR